MWDSIVTMRARAIGCACQVDNTLTGTEQANPLSNGAGARLSLAWASRYVLAASDHQLLTDVEMLDAVARLNGRVFDNDPVVAYMLLDMPREERLAYLPTYWSILIRSAVLNHALITEADGWKAASVLIPPGRYIDNAWTLIYAGLLCFLWRIGFTGLKRLWTEFSGMTDFAKKKGLRGQKRYYYVFSIGTEYEHRGKGLAKTIMRYHQSTAQARNLPIWLEATTPSSRDLYLSLGFEEIEKIILGKGKVAADASVQPGGPGIPLYAMVWHPESSGPVSEPLP